MSELKDIDIERQYKTHIDGYKSVTNEILRLIDKTLSDRNIRVAFPIESRIKSLESLIEKHNRNRTAGGYKIKSKIEEVNDIIGLRIVVLYPDHKENIIKHLTDLFLGNVKVRDSKPSSIKEFSYTSSHLICSIPPSWVEVPTWQNAQNKSFEIQIRTLSEHTWATLSHDLFYKKENIPEELERELSKIKALLEVTDDRIVEIKNKAIQYSDRIENLDYQEVLELKLDPATFKRVFDEFCEGYKHLDAEYHVEQSFLIETIYEIKTVKLLDELVRSLNKKWTDMDELYFDMEIVAGEHHKSMLKRNEEKEKFYMWPDEPPLDIEIN